MCRLFETIRIVDGEPHYPGWHELRMNRAREEFWKDQPPLSLMAILPVPVEFSKGIVRCKVVYGPAIVSIDFKPYEKKPIRTLRLVHCCEIDYHVKFTDRSHLELLFAQRGISDEIIIVKDGWITDTSMSNLIFFDGEDWITPTAPLLRGTNRERLLSEGKLIERSLRPEDLGNYLGCKLINAMRIPEEEDIILVKEISG